MRKSTLTLQTKLGNLTDMKYIYTKSDFEGFIVDDYLPHQIYELTTNKLEEE